MERGCEARKKARGPSECLQEAGRIPLDREGGKGRRNQGTASQKDYAQGGEGRAPVYWGDMVGAAGGHILVNPQ